MIFLLTPPFIGDFLAMLPTWVTCPGLFCPVAAGTSGSSAAAAFLPLGSLGVATESHGEVGSTEVGAGSAAAAGRKGAKLGMDKGIACMYTYNIVY